MTKCTDGNRRGFAAAVGAVVVILPLLVAPAAGWAQSKPGPAATPTPAKPAAPQAGMDGAERVTAQFGDWSVTCATRQNTKTRGCEMATAIQGPNRQVTAMVAIGRAASGEPLRLVVQVPVNVLVVSPAQLVTEGPEPITLPFRTCNTLGCFAELELRDEALLRRLRAQPAGQPGRLQWRDAGNNELAVPVSLNGFAAAYDALARENG